jgi:hypothetical protein
VAIATGCGKPWLLLLDGKIRSQHPLAGPKMVVL